MKQVMILCPLLILGAVVNSQAADRKDKQVVGIPGITNASIPGKPSSATNIVCPSAASANIKLAAKEIHRYVYLRTGALLPIAETGNGITFQVDSALESQQYRLKTDGDTLTISGGSDLAVLYGTYAFIEKLGVRFYLHGDVIPDKQIKFAIPDVDETHKPLFEMRGINPWATHVYGFEHWEKEGFRSVLTQMLKMRMNFIGMHNYNEGGWGSEPTVWVGMPEDIEENGDPKFSYTSFYFNTERQLGGGQNPVSTDQYGYGGSLLFETDKWGVSVMKGHMPYAQTLAGKNEVFIRTGHLLREAFEYAHRLGIKTALGTEIPLNHETKMLPHEVRDHLKKQGKAVTDREVHKALYRGTFLRAMKTYPLDYFWLWTPEAWRLPESKTDVQKTRDDLLLAVEAAKEVNAPFTLATAGWVLGPAVDRVMYDRILPKDMPFAALNEHLGRVPVDGAFKHLKERPGWAIPWMENDLSSNSPQLWVGRILRDALDAYNYGCNGLMGLHWRTTELSPMVGALVQAQWQAPVAPAPPIGDKGIVVRGGKLARTTASQKDTVQELVYQSCRYSLQGYDFKVPNGKYKITLQFNEPHFNAPGKRVFGVTIQGQRVIKELDIFARVGKNCALDLDFSDITVEKGKLSVEFLSDISQELMEGDRKNLDVHYVSHPCISGIVLEGPETIKLNCGGPAWREYRADPNLKGASLPRFLPTEDFYRDWVLHQFGPEASEEIATIFSRMDGHLPTPASVCPGKIQSNANSWETVKGSYAFVDELAALRPKIVGKGNLDRFDYWLNSFTYLRAIGRVGCSLGALDQGMRGLARKKTAEEKKAYALTELLPLRVRLNQDWGRMVTLAMEVAESWGGIGHVIGHEATNKRFRERHDRFLKQVLGEDLPVDATPWQEYRGKPRLIVLTPNGHRTKDEAVTLKVMVLDNQKPRSAALHWRPLGARKWNDVSLTHVGRAVHRVTLPAEDKTVEYYIDAETANGSKLRWPATAPQINQTIVTLE